MRHIYPSAIWRIPGKEKKIFLTFDDGPIPEITPWVLALLKKYNAKATFFCIGNNVEKNPDIFRQIIAEGHCVGNHTYNHLNGWKTKKEEYSENILKCDLALNRHRLSVTGNQSNIYHPPITDNRLPLFRPPYGRMKQSQYSLLTTQYSVIMWDVLSWDFDPGVSEERCLKNVCTKTREGSIVVFHDSLKAKKNLYYVLPKFVEHFQKKGFSFELL